MSAASSYNTKSFRSAMLLLVVYALQLAFFQVLMQTPPAYNIDSSFKTLYDTHQTKHSNHSVPAAKHPAVTCYTMLVKQGNNIGSTSNTVTPAIQQLDAVVTPTVLSALYHINQTSVGQLHFAEDIFKVYRRIGVFLI